MGDHPMLSRARRLLSRRWAVLAVPCLLLLLALALARSTQPSAPADPAPPASVGHDHAGKGSLLLLKARCYSCHDPHV